MKKILGLAASGLMALAATLGLSAAAPAQADTIVSATETHYDSSLRVDCVAIRMNPANFSNAPSSACTAQTAGAYGPDRITQTIYDAAGEVTEVDRGVGTGTGFLNQRYARYTYNLVGLKTSETDANGNMTAYIYDTFDRVSQIQYPSTTLGSGNINTADYETFGYDLNNNKTTWRRRNGKALTYGFDALNREITRSVSDGSVQAVYSGYDLQSHLLYARYGSTSGAGVTNTYDGLGRLGTTTDMNGRAISYLYDTASNRTRLTYPDSNYQPYTYDADDRVTASGLGSGTYGIGHDNLGRVSAIGHGSGNAAGLVSLVYDNLGRLTSLTNDIAGTANDVNWTFAYSPGGQIATITPSSTLYDYQETATSTLNNAYDGLNRDAGIAALAGGFDSNGNLTNDGTRTFTYDVNNHLLTAASAGNSLSLVYDPLGRLASQTYNGVLTAFLYDGTNLIAEYNSSGAITQRYVFGPGTDQPLIWYQGSQTTTPLYFVQDYHGSVIGYTDASGNLQASYKYGPYGEPKTSANVTSFAGPRFRYTGQAVIPEASLYYYKARVYDPIYGRFLQTDPIGSKDDLDLYAYTGDDPIDHSDPTGLAACGSTISQSECSQLMAAQEAAKANINENISKVEELKKEKAEIAAGSRSDLSTGSMRTSAVIAENASNMGNQATDSQISKYEQGLHQSLTVLSDNINYKYEAQSSNFIANYTGKGSAANTVFASSTIWINNDFYREKPAYKRDTLEHEPLHIFGKNLLGMPGESYDNNAFGLNNADTYVQIMNKCANWCGVN